MAGRDTETGIVGQVDGGGAGGERQVHEVQPGAGEAVDVHEVRRIEETGEEDEALVREALAPVEVRDAEFLVAEGRREETRVTELVQPEELG